MEMLKDYPNYMSRLVKQEYFHLNLTIHYFINFQVIFVYQVMVDSNKIKQYEA